MRQDLAVNLLEDALLDNPPVSSIAVDMLYAARQEQRSVTVYMLGAALAGDIPPPSEAEVKAYYQTHTNDFIAPEYRSISYVSISDNDVRNKVHVSEDDLQSAYRERIEEFKRPERRVVEQLLYNSEDKARHALTLLKGGECVEDVAKDTDILNKKALSLGEVEHSNIIEAAADTVFSLPEGGIAGPIKSPFGWHLFYVQKIIPPSVASFDNVRATLEKDLHQRASDDAINALATKFEDTLASGSTLKEAAGDLGLKMTSIGPVDRQGKTTDGSRVKDIPEYDKFLETAFKT